MLGLGMGAAYSTGTGYVSESLFTGAKRQSAHLRGAMQLKRPGRSRQKKCAAVPPYADMRGWALMEIYGVPRSKISMYPPYVYSIEQARDDIDACRLGQDLPHYQRVVRYEKIAKGTDPRVYALTEFHGYTKKELRNGQVLSLLPYTEKDAQIDISEYTKRGRPYYKVVKHTSQVIDPKRGTVKNWRNKGFDNKHTYNYLDPRAKRQNVRRLGDIVERRFDLSKYRKETRAGRTIHFIPCRELPAMCRPGDAEFPWVGDGEDRTGQTVANAIKRAPKDRWRNAVKRIGALRPRPGPPPRRPNTPKPVSRPSNSATSVLPSAPPLERSSSSAAASAAASDLARKREQKRQRQKIMNQYSRNIQIIRDARTRTAQTPYDEQRAKRFMNQARKRRDAELKKISRS